MSRANIISSGVGGGGGSSFLTTPVVDVSDNNFYYYGGLLNGNWKVVRIAISNLSSRTYASVSNNPAISTLSSAWSGKGGLIYT